MSDDQINLIIKANADSFKAALKDARSELKSFDNSSTGTGLTVGRAFSGIGSAVASAGKKIASVAWDYTKVGAITAATAVVGLGTAGITSANNLQSLQLSMNGLTHSVDLGAKAMAGAYEYAQKAPFQLPEVAGATKSLIAYGMTASQAVGNLETLGNVSITTGVPIEHLAGIFGQVSAQGTLMLGDIRQLTENGVAILPALQKEFGKTATQVQDMATAGEISFDEFNKALQSLVDPSMLDQLNNTLPRQIDRLKGSIRQLSNAFVGVSVDAQNGFTMMSNGIAQSATNLVKNVADQLRSPEIKSAFAQIGTQVAPIIDQVGQMVKPLVGVIISISQPLASLFTGVAGGLLAALNGALPGITTFFNALNGAFQALAPVFSQVGTMVGNGIGSIMSELAPLLEPLVQVLSILGPEFVYIASTIAQFAVQLAGALVPILPVVASALDSILQPLIDGLKPLLPVIVTLMGALAGSFADIVKALIPILPPLIEFVMTILQQILLPLLPGLVQLIQFFARALVMVITAITPLLPPIMQLVQTLIGALAPMLPLLIQMFIQLAMALLPILPPLLQLVTILLPPLIALVNLAAQAASVFSNILAAVLVASISGVIQIIGALVGWLSMIYQWFGNLGIRVSNVAVQMINSVGSSISGIVSWFAALPGRINSAIGNTGSLLYDKGRNIVQGLLDGASSLLSKLGNMFLDKLPGWIKEPFKKALGIHSPSKVFSEYGGYITEGLANGITDAQSSVKSAVSNLGDAVTGNFTTSVGINGGRSATSGSSTAVQQTVQPQQQSPSIIVQSGASFVSIQFAGNAPGDFTDAQAVSIAGKISDALKAQGLTVNEMGSLRQ